MAIGISNVRGKQSRSAISSPISTPVTKMKTQHELRYEDFVLSTSSKSLDALNDSLNESSDAFSFIVFPASMSRSLPTPPRYHTAFLSDLRLRKIYEGLQQMTSEVAAAEVTQLFDRYFDEYKQKWKPGVTIRPECDHYSVAAALFLCAEFADKEATLERIDSWNLWYEVNKGREGQFDDRARILPLFLVNTYCRMLIKDGMELESVNFLIANFGEDSSIKRNTLVTKPLHKWDRHIVATEPISFLTLVPSWSSRILKYPNLYDGLIDFLRASLDE